MLNKESLEAFIYKISDFNSLSKTKQIDYFLYFLDINDINPITAKKVSDCFDLVNLDKYSNISSYLASVSFGKNKKLLKKKPGEFILIKNLRDEFDKEFALIKPPPPSDSLFPRSMFNDTRGYLINMSDQAALAYDLGLYDACAVMLRKLLETLIIECFERFKIDSKIKDKNGDFLYLRDLTSKLLNESIWNIGRNQKSGFEKIKKMGDLSAHNRRYCATKIDIDKLKDDLRLCLQELIGLIDYKNWR